MDRVSFTNAVPFLKQQVPAPCAATPSATMQRALVVAALTAAMTGCGTVMTSPPSGFLSSYDMVPLTDTEAAAPRRKAVPIDPARLKLAEVDWRVDEGAGITDEERIALTTQLRAELVQSLSASPAGGEGRAVLLRAAITNVEPVSPALNTVSALLLFVPLQRGGAAVEIEAIDAESGQQLVAMKSGYFPPMTELKARFSKLAPAQIALRKLAGDFARLLGGG